MEGAVGVLVDRRTLMQALRGRRTLERIHLYRSIALEEGLNLLLFCVEHVDAGRGRTVGYIPTAKGWKRVRAPVPRVVHKRVLFRTSAPLRTLGRLQRRGVVFVNPYLIQNKARMGAVLARDERVRPHIPETHPYRPGLLEAFLKAGRSAILKPRVGSVGKGLVRVVPLARGRAEVTGKKARVMSLAALRRRLAGRISTRRYLLQEYLPLARCKGRPFDLRVPVQRDGSGEWRTPGMVAKVAARHPYLTNMAQGGRAIPGEAAIAAAFPAADAPGVIERVRRLAVDVARAVAREHPHAADLGLDIGVDRDGRPWLIEVNTRDQRYTFHEAGMHDTFRTLYKNPLLYCARLLDELRLDEGRQEST